MLISVDYAWPLPATQLLCIICTVCEQPALVYRGPQLHCVPQLESFVLQVSFTLTLCSGSSPSPAAGWTQDYPRMLMFSLHEIFKFKIYSIRRQARKQTYTHMCNAVLLVWGSLRLAQNTSLLLLDQIDLCREVLTLEIGEQQDVLMKNSKLKNYRDRQLLLRVVLHHD